MTLLTLNDVIELIDETNKSLDEAYVLLAKLNKTYDYDGLVARTTRLIYASYEQLDTLRVIQRTMIANTQL